MEVTASSYLNDEQEDESKDESSIEVADVEGGTESSNQGVATDDDGQEHGSKLGAESLDQGVEHGSSGNGQAHHHNQVGEEGKAAEGQVGSLSKTGLDHLKNTHFY